MISDLQAIIIGYFERKPFTFGSEGTADRLLSRPQGICVDQKGQIYVSDTGNNRVQIFSHDGKWLHTLLPPPRSSNGFFEGPTGVAIGPDGSIYICGISNHVVVDQSDWKFSRYIGAGRISWPRSVAVSLDGSMVYVTERNSCVSAFKSDGSFIGEFAKFGTGNSRVISPIGLAVGPDGNVYVSDNSRAVVQIYTSADKHVRIIGHDPIPIPYGGTIVGPLSAPQCVAVSADGLVFVADSCPHCVKVSSSTGTLLYQLDGTHSLYGVAVGSHGFVYASSPDQNAIVAFPYYDAK